MPPAPPVTGVHLGGDKLHLPALSTGMLPPRRHCPLEYLMTWASPRHVAAPPPASLFPELVCDLHKLCLLPLLIAVKIGFALLTAVVPPRVVGIICYANEGRCQAIIVIMDQSVDSFFWIWLVAVQRNHMASSSHCSSLAARSSSSGSCFVFCRAEKTFRMMDASSLAQSPELDRSEEDVPEALEHRWPL